MFLKRTVRLVKRIDLTMWGMLLLMLFGYVLIHDVFGGTLFSYHPWDSYTLQAIAWKNGELTIDGSVYT